MNSSWLDFLRFFDFYQAALRVDMEKTQERHFWVTPDAPHPIQAWSTHATVQALWQLFSTSTDATQAGDKSGGALFSDNGSKELWHRAP